MDLIHSKKSYKKIAERKDFEPELICQFPDIKRKSLPIDKSIRAEMPNFVIPEFKCKLSATRPKFDQALVHPEFDHVRRLWWLQTSISTEQSAHQTERKNLMEGRQRRRDKKPWNIIEHF